MSTEAPRNEEQQEGDARKRRATSRVNRKHRVRVRRVQRAFLAYLMQHASGTVDSIRDLLSIPDHAGTAFWGSAVLGLSLARLIRRVKFVVSHRPERHGCHIGEWELAVEHEQVRHWLTVHAELRDEEEPGDDAGTASTAPRTPPTPAPLASGNPTQTSLF